jgi:D-alanine-D-alanine ligase
MRKALTGIKVLVLFDLPEPTPCSDQLDFLIDNSDRPTESDVCKALLTLGAEVSCFGLYDDVKPLSLHLQSIDLVFNLCETFKGDRQYESNVAAYLEMLGVPFTGCPAASLNLCKNKALSKQVAAWAGIPIPYFSLAQLGQTVFEDIVRPSLVKPVDLEGSEGISQASFVRSTDACHERIQFIHERYATNVIVEEFIFGHDIYVGVIGSKHEVTALPPRILQMDDRPDGKPQFATYHAKWNEDFRRRWNVNSELLETTNLPLIKQLTEFATSCFRAFQMQGYGRIDFRLSSEGKIFFIEANPNPALSSEDELALAAGNMGLAYEDLIAHVVTLTLPHHFSNKSAGVA